MHEHRRQHDTDDASGHRMERIADSTIAKLVVRIVMPALFSVAVVLASVVMSGMRTDLTSVKNSQQVFVREFSKDQAVIKSDVRDLTTRFDTQAIRELTTTVKRVDDLEKRMTVVERAIPTP